MWDVLNGIWYFYRDFKEERSHFLIGLISEGKTSASVS